MPTDDLFSVGDNIEPTASAPAHAARLAPLLDQSPLAAAVRPTRVSEVVGQPHLLGERGPLARMIASGRLHSMILWGPPGVGKTTLARILAQSAQAEFVALSAVTAGLKEIREAVQVAHRARLAKRKTILFLDEVHRFNKAQQDALLPHLEDGTLTFIGATTENPSFELNSALLSRAKVYRLQALSEDALRAIVVRVLQLKSIAEENVDPRALTRLVILADGDGRRALNLLELWLAESSVLDEASLELALTSEPKRFDKRGDIFYDQISALHKSVRGSAVDASLYWLARMLTAGCDSLYIARRVVRMATEDIGTADPQALTIALNAWDCLERLGSPEGELALVQAVVYLASAPKSNAVYRAWQKVVEQVESTGSLEVPMHLRNAPTALMKNMGYGQGYRYAQDEVGAYAAGERYLPDNLPALEYYQPSDRGAEAAIAARLAQWRRLDELAAVSPAHTPKQGP